MEEARIILALVLSVAVFIVWFLYFTPKQVEKTDEALEQNSVQTKSNHTKTRKFTKLDLDSQQIIKQGESIIEPQRMARTVTVNTPLYSISFSERGAAIINMTLNHFRETVEPDSPKKQLINQELNGGTMMVSLGDNENQNLEQAVYTLDTNDETIDVHQTPGELMFSFETRDNVTIEKKYMFFPDSYLIDVEVRIRNNRASVLNDTLRISLRDILKEGKQNRGFSGPSGLINKKLKQVLPKKIDEKSSFQGLLSWIAIESQYFITALICDEPLDGAMELKNTDHAIENQMALNIDNLSPAQCKELRFELFMGPKNWALLKSYRNNLDRAIDFGWVDIIAKPCLWFMNFIYKFIPNYGFAIILLTFVTRLAFWPLTRISYKSMNEMRKIQPMVQKIREKYKDDKLRMNQETMALYRTYKVNPLGGCMPMLFQLPVFFALYSMLYSAIELRHAPFFGWINDLSAPDRLFNFDISLPYMQPPIGIPVLTLIMGGTMILQQKMMPTSADPTQAKMMLLMPVILTLVFINFPSGLVLYWLVGNIISISQQYFTQKKLA